MTMNSPEYCGFALTLLLVSLTDVVPCAAAQQPLLLVKQGQARASIVLDDQAGPTAQEAAVRLQQVVERMTGAVLPIVNENKFDGQLNAILVGQSELATRMGIQIHQDADQGDHYIVRSGPKYLALVGNDDPPLRGSAYAVYDLLQRLGCGWYGPDKLWHVIPQSTNLVVPALDIDERPAFLYRDIWLVGDLSGSEDGQAVIDAWRMGGRPVSSGHALDGIVPREKYQKDHPEYFGPVQPCLTHPEVIKIAADFCRQTIDKRAKGIVDFSLSPIDDGGFCDCERCRAVGNTSACMLYFANAVAKDLERTHRGRYLLTFYAYWHTHSPPQPMIKAEPGVCVMQVNAGNHVQAWDKLEPAYIRQAVGGNTAQIQAFRGWKKTGAQIAIYEWWIPGDKKAIWYVTPWYSGETALCNLRYWHAGGVRFVTYETKNERAGGFPLRWPLYYVAARGLWEPGLTCNQIMNEACEKLYGPAAENMFNYYHTLEMAMANSKLYAKNWGLPWPHEIYTEGIENKATEFLQAAGRATTDPVILLRIKAEQAIWSQAREAIAELRKTQPAKSFEVILDGQSRPWPLSTIDGDSIRELCGLDRPKSLFAVRTDGSKVAVSQDEVFDLSSGVTFTTEP